MDFFSFSKSFHIIGIALWLGAGLVLSFLAMYASKKTIDSEGKRDADIFFKAIKRAWLFFVCSGMVIVVFTGIYQLMLKGVKFYFALGWFHLKITIAVLSIVLTIAMLLFLSSNPAMNYNKFKLVHTVMGAILVILVVLTKLNLVV